MKDLDFDELDRAVNSLMTSVPKSAPQRNDEKVNTLDITSTLDDKDATPPFKKVEEAAANVTSDQKSDDTPAESAPKEEDVSPAPAVTPQPSVSSAPAARRGGRFMDVVHPSADMSKPDTPRPISRQGATIEPLGASQKIADIIPKKRETTEKTEKTEEVVEEPKEEPVVATAPQSPAEPEAKTEESASTSDWPDPLDMMPAAKDEKEETTEPSEPEEPKDEESTSPLTSPFLPDTKVEKRPLGGIPSEEEPSTSAVEEPDRAPVIPVDATPKTIDDPNAQLPADPNAVELQLPEELSGDLMAVEADTTHDELKQAHENETPQAAATAPKATEPKTGTAVAEPPVPSGPTSIPQQYREEPNTGDKDNVPIYDTDTYHQPLSHPAKKKSGWMWVIWIVLILLVGAGGGAALYFLRLV
jgi:hypothetical protein